MIDEALPVATEKIGWIKIAFCYACYYLKHNFTFENAIKESLLIGGDTDTNAAIVGGLIGAARGIEGIPADWISKVLNSENKRPDFI